MQPTLIPAIQRASHSITAFLDAAAPEVTPADAQILAHLVVTGVSTVGQIHDAFGYKRSTLTSILNRLEERSLVTCRVNASDRRSFLIAVTPAGDGIGRMVRDKFVGLESEILGAFSPREQKSALLVLSALTAMVNDLTAAA